MMIWWFLLQPGDPEYKKFIGHDNLVKQRQKNLRLFEDKKPRDFSFAEVNKKRNDIMNGITDEITSSDEPPQQKISLSNIYKEISLSNIYKEEDGGMQTKHK